MIECTSFLVPSVETCVYNYCAGCCCEFSLHFCHGPSTPLTLPQCPSSSVGSAANKDGEDEVLAGSVHQITPVSTNRSSNETWDSKEILNLLKTGNKWAHETLEHIDSTLSASTLDLKKYWCLWMEASMKDIHPSLWRSFQDQCYQMIT